MRAIQLFLVFVLSLGITGCSWVPNEPIHIPTASPSVRNFDAILSAVRDLGYEVKVEDKSRGYLQLIANLNKGETVMRGFAFGARAVQATSFISITIRERSVDITATGFHVRENNTVMKAQLRDELIQLAQAIADNLGSTVRVARGQ